LWTLLIAKSCFVDLFSQSITFPNDPLPITERIVNDSIVNEVNLNVAARSEMIHSIMLSCDGAKKVIG
jgi:hypothetical protein